MGVRYFDTTQKGNHSSFLTPTVVGGRHPLPCEICAESDPPPSQHKQVMFCAGPAWRITTVDNCTMNFSGVDTAHHSRTVLSAIAELLVTVTDRSSKWTVICQTQRTVTSELAGSVSLVPQTSVDSREVFSVWWCCRVWTSLAMDPQWRSISQLLHVSWRHKLWLHGRRHGALWTIYHRVQPGHHQLWSHLHILCY